MGILPGKNCLPDHNFIATWQKLPTLSLSFPFFKKPKSQGIAGFLVLAWLLLTLCTNRYVRVLI
ncbi:hypothetical protein ID47_02145 [Candidatus Paracaedibacter acanthamoebae]|uniref:Uncharacterized protein n=1 Tax=Candidatus Odyssella acanthamoebae TaxID=91604 RepID=A0A077AYJ2_9PROT|nr:hypothetical protein ID47_02145 [Candidatus Paracaedibacter acanthamoebae]